MAKPSKETLKKLHDTKQKLVKHNYQYYALDKPIITDLEYDQLYAQLLKIEQNHPDLITPDSPSQRVGDTPLDQFEKQDHRQPMLSLQNSYSPEDILAFYERCQKFLDTKDSISLYCEPKLDGLAIELVYEDGLLVGALTRGDGFTGENVLSNVKTIRAIPLRLKTKTPPKLLEVRGEIVMLKQDFKNLNQTQQDLGQEPFANPRNAAAGTIRQLDPKITAQRPLRVYCYGYGEVDGYTFTTQKSFMEWIAELGLPTVQGSDEKLIKTSDDPQQAIKYYHLIEQKRHELSFDIDGVVLKVNDIKLQTRLGKIARSPRWANAAKFKPDQAETKVQDIIVQVGRTGALTPVAIMDPVKVGGVTITHATLHNQDEIDRKDVRIGDYVFIQRAGDVIPDIVKVNLDKRDKKNSKAFKIPHKCPSCSSEVEHIEGEVVLRCTNPVCPAVIRQSLKHFVSRRAMNIDKLGEKIIEQLADNNLVHHYSDLYKLDLEQIMSMDRQGKKSAQNIIESIDKSRKPSLGRFIFSLGIRFVGEQTAKTLAKYFGTIENFLKSDHAELLTIDDVGPKVADSILRATSNKSFAQEIILLQKNGVEILFEQSPSGSQILAGMNIVVTGTLPAGRDEIKDLITANGGKSASSVSKNTSYVLAGEAAGSKLDKANQLGVKVLNWEDFLALINKKAEL